VAVLDACEMRPADFSHASLYACRGLRVHRVAGMAKTEIEKARDEGQAEGMMAAL
jgi:hypothetical protein